MCLEVPKAACLEFVEHRPHGDLDDKEDVKCLEREAGGQIGVALLAAN
jgi:hypothetical protein